MECDLSPRACLALERAISNYLISQEQMCKQENEQLMVLLDLLRLQDTGTIHLNI
jgi:hypothetical protein